MQYYIVLEKYYLHDDNPINIESSVLPSVELHSYYNHDNYANVQRFCICKSNLIPRIQTYQLSRIIRHETCAFTSSHASVAQFDTILQFHSSIDATFCMLQVNFKEIWTLAVLIRGRKLNIIIMLIQAFQDYRVSLNQSKSLTYEIYKCIKLIMLVNELANCFHSVCSICSSVSGSV